MAREDYAFKGQRWSIKGFLLYQKRKFIINLTITTVQHGFYHYVFAVHCEQLKYILKKRVYEKAQFMIEFDKNSEGEMATF